MEGLLNSLAQGGQLTFPLVFLAGVLSFFSPCVLPVLPLYLGYLSKGAKSSKKAGKAGNPGSSAASGAGVADTSEELESFSHGKVLLHTLFFILGISAAFFLLGLGFSALGRTLAAWKPYILRVGGGVLIVFGLWMILSEFMPKLMGSGRELRFKMPQFKSVNPGIAFLLGFIFSFAWTPCVGPILASVLLLITANGQMGYAFFLIAAYTLGFVIPFILLGLFTTKILNLLRRRRKLLSYTSIAGGVLVLIMGLLMTFGLVGSINSYLARFSAPASSQSSASQAQAGDSNNSSSSSQDKKDDTTASTSAAGEGQKKPDRNDEQAHPIAPDFTLTDQNGKTHKLSDYKGKTIFLNFWATWCGPCRHEIPDIIKLYEQHGKNTKDVIVLGVANPSTGGAQMVDGSLDEVKNFIKEEHMDYPVLMDLDGSVFSKYQVNAFPTTYIIRPDGRISGFIPGAIPGTIMERVVNEAKAE